MKKLLSILFALISLSVFGQSGSQAVSGIKYRVNDTTAYQSAVATAHSQGYSDIYWNNQATTPHWDIWNGSSYDHVFDFNSGGSGTTEYTIEVITGTGPHTITDADNGKIFLYTNALGCSVLLGDGFTEGISFTAVRQAGAGNIEFQADGTATLHTVGGELIIEVDEGWASWVLFPSDEWRGTGVLGPASSGGGTWGTITGTLSDQTDLQTALDGKVNDTGNETIAGVKTFSSTITGSISGNAATVTTNANLTGHVTSTGNAAVLGSFSSSNLSTALTDEVGTGSAVFSEPDVNVQTGSYTLVLTDKAKEVRMNVAGSNNLTVPLNSSVAFPIGTLINISQYGAGTTTVVATGGVTINSSAGNLLSPGQFSPMILRKIGTDEWYLWNGAAAVTAAFTRTNGTYITTTLSGSMSGALNTAVDITVDLTGVVPLTLGGTGASSATQTYTPTFTNTTNVAASTPRACQYMRVGNTITVSGQFDIDPTATGQIVMGISLPVASAFTTAFQAGGTAAPTTVADAPAAIISDATNDRATLTYVCVDTTNHTMAFTFTYQVL